MNSDGGRGHGYLGSPTHADSGLAAAGTVTDLGKLLIALGGLLVLVGVALVVLGRIPGLGRLPGDIVIERGTWTFYFPLATSVVLSLLLTVVLWLIGRR